MTESRIIYAPPDAECDAAFAEIVEFARRSRTIGVANEAEDIAFLVLEDGADTSDWDTAMRRASGAMLVCQAYAGTATIATPAAQRRAGVRESVLRAHSGPSKAERVHERPEAEEEPEHVHLIKNGRRTFCGQEHPVLPDPRFTSMWADATCPKCDEEYEKALPRTSDGAIVRIVLSDDP